MNIYISGAITGTTDYMKRFRKAEYKLKRMGYDVVNPAKVGAKLPGNSSWNFYMEVSITLLKNCEAIYMLEGWQKSSGANIELFYAQKHNKSIFYENQ